MYRYAVLPVTMPVTLLVMLLAAPAFAQTPPPPPVSAADCSVDVDLAAGLKLDIRYRCRSSSALTFEPVGRVDSQNGIVDARYQLDLARRTESDGRELILRGDSALATLGSWLATPRGYERLPVIDIKVHAASGLGFAAGLPKVGDAWRLEGASMGLAGYTALGKASLQDIAVPAPGSLKPGVAPRSGVLHLAILDGVSDGARADLVDWVKRTAEAESNYWLGFTAAHMLVGLVPSSTRGPAGYGRTVSGGIPACLIFAAAPPGSWRARQPMSSRSSARAPAGRRSPRHGRNGWITCRRASQPLPVA
jgi:hypothetical protein